jgi:hypothetical protein
MSVAAFVFVVLKREDVTLEWAGFLDRNIEELFGSTDDDETDEAETPKPKAKPRPTKSA